ncbi:VOC family protein [Domibacillus epiphyticus]|nr:VOC family protein [Domibacillus epiphyticus]
MFTPEHTGIMVSNMDESIAFYEEILGFTLRVKSKTATKEIAFLSHDRLPGFEVELLLDLDPKHSYAEQGIVNHLAFSVDDYDQAMAELQRKGIPFLADQPTIGEGGRRAIRFAGPNKEVLQIVEKKD